MFTDENFPSHLKEIDRPPSKLYWRGSSPPDWLSLPRVAIVGSRKASNYGTRVTQRLSRELASAGVVVISGLAYGIDAIAHRAAADAKGITVAVLGNSLDKIYPVANQQLAEQIIRTGGCLISEYGSGQPVMAYQFIARNRVISGLADVVVVAEAAAGSGSLHTAQFGLEQGKTIMAVPGPIDQPSYFGCNHLIKTGALPVTSVEDIFLALGLTPKQRAKLAPRFDNPTEAKLYQLLQREALDMDQLAYSAGLTAAELSRALTGLELNGYIRPSGAGRWTIK